MPTLGGFVQACNAQVGVDIETHLIVEQHLSQSPNVKWQVEPTLENIAQRPEGLGQVAKLLADTGYYSKANVNQCGTAGAGPFYSRKTPVP